MDGFENLDQGVSQKLKLKKDGCGQELFGQDMIDSESVFQFLDDVFRIAPLPVEPDDFRPAPIGVGDVESVTEPILGEKRPLVFFSANNDQAIGGSFLFRTEEVDRFADFFFSPASAKRLPSSNPPNQGRNRLRLPSSNDESDTFPVAGFHQPVVITGRVGSNHDRRFGEMGLQKSNVLPDQTHVVFLGSFVPQPKHGEGRQVQSSASNHSQKRIESPESIIGHLRHPHVALDQGRVNIQNQPLRLPGPKRPNGQPHSDFGQGVNFPPAELAGQVGHRIRSGNTRHPGQSQQAGVGIQKIQIIQPVSALDDHS